jgi:predicted nucleic acid-binding protein
VPVLVDTNVLIDVLTDDPRWASWSIAQLEKNSSAGLIINPVIYAELCFGCPSIEFVDDVVRRFGLIYQDISRQGLFLAAQAFRLYKSRKGIKTAVLPDFFVGGHAEAARLPLLTRDTKRLGSYFPGVKLLCPRREL